MRFYNYVVLIFLLLSFNSSYSQNKISYNDITAKTVDIKAWKINYKDSIAWKDADYNHCNWSTLNKFEDINQTKEPMFWLLNTITIKEDNSGTQALSLILGFLGNAYDLYWDGVLISSNGKTGRDPQTEITGKILQIVPIPMGLTGSGNHSLAIRVSNSTYSELCSYTAISIGLTSFFTDFFTEKNTASIVIASIFFTFALFNIILFWGFNKDISLLYLTLFCLAQTVKTGLESSFILAGLTLNQYIFFTGLINPLVLLSGIFLVAFLISKFQIPYQKKLFLAYFALTVVSYILVSARIYIVIMMFVSFLLAIYSLYKRKEGSILILIGLSGFGIFTYIGYLGFFNFGYFIGIIFFIVCIAISTARQISNQIALRNQAATRAARLESELLKKNIQPHFVLNSLSSLQELVETAPQRAVEFIDALAEEFRLFARISNEKLISIKDELNICETHLKIMGFRKDAKFTLSAEGFIGNEMVPPAIFHTLVENGITHGYAKKNSGIFNLTKEKMGNGVLYSLFNDSDPLKTYNPDKKGSGLKYVESRLEESYPGRWNLAAAPVSNGWMVTIKIFNESFAGKVE